MKRRKALLGRDLILLENFQRGLQKSSQPFLEESVHCALESCVSHTAPSSWQAARGPLQRTRMTRPELSPQETGGSHDRTPLRYKSASSPLCVFPVDWQDMIQKIEESTIFIFHPAENFCSYCYYQKRSRIWQLNPISSFLCSVYENGKEQGNSWLQELMV